MLIKLDIMNNKMLLEVEKLNNMIYGYDQYFNYEMHKDDFTQVTTRMEIILQQFQYKNREILSTLNTKPEKFWIYHIDFCKKKCEKMHQFDIRLEKLCENPVKLKNYDLYNEIDDFNRSMSLPAFQYKNIRPKLSELLTYIK